MCQSYTICKTPDNVWPLVKTNHPPAQKEAWHWSNQTIMVTKTTVVSVKSGKKGIPRKVLLFLPENFHRDERFIWILHGITGFSIQMVSAPCLPHRGPLKNARLTPLGRDKHNCSWLGHHCKYSNNSPLPGQYHIPTHFCPVFSLTVVAKNANEVEVSCEMMLESAAVKVRLFDWTWSFLINNV